MNSRTALTTLPGYEDSLHLPIWTCQDYIGCSQPLKEPQGKAMSPKHFFHQHDNSFGMTSKLRRFWATIRREGPFAGGSTAVAQ
jgi:hypothetical protein